MLMQQLITPGLAVFKKLFQPKKLLQETRLKSESFEPLIDFLAFLVQKFWSKINKLIN